MVRTSPPSVFTVRMDPMVCAYNPSVPALNSLESVGCLPLSGGFFQTLRHFPDNCQFLVFVIGSHYLGGGSHAYLMDPPSANFRSPSLSLMTVVGDDGDIPAIDGRESVLTAAIKDPEGPNLETDIRMQMF